jgi:hypothetical protein
MPYVTSVERLAKEEGAREALQSTICSGLQARFGSLEIPLIKRIDEIENLEHLQVLARSSYTVRSIEAFQKLLDK